MVGKEDQDEDDEDDEEDEEEAGGTPPQDQRPPHTKRRAEAVPIVRPPTPINTSSAVGSLTSSGPQRVPEVKSNVAPVVYPTMGMGKVRMVRQSALGRAAQALKLQV